MTTGPRAHTHHVAVGICILMLGVLLVLDRLGIVGADRTLRFWPVGLIIIGFSVIVQAFRGETGTTRSSVPWGAIFWLLVLGFGMTQVFDRRASATQSEASGGTSIFAVMSGQRRVPGGDFKSAEITTVMGGAQLDLRQAKVNPGEELTVDVFTLMGGAVIYVPEDWIVDTRAVSLLGGIQDERRRSNGRGGPRGGRGAGPTWPNVDFSVDFDPSPGGLDAPVPPAPPAPPTPPAPPAPSNQDVEAPDGAIPAAPPKLVIRGYVTMGGLAIKSR